jgi:hypothetical protein
MFSPKNTDTPNPFRPALQYLLSEGRPRKVRHRRNSTLDSLDSDSGRVQENMTYNSQQSSSGLHAGPVPLITLSRSNSPFARKRSSSNPDSDSDEDDQNGSSSRRPFLLHDDRRRVGWQGLMSQGGLGQWLFTTPSGWSFYVGFLVLWVGGCGLGLICMNRIVLLSKLRRTIREASRLTLHAAGVYKFPYPLTTTLIQLLMTHGLLIISANLTKLMSSKLIAAGLSSMVAPSRPVSSPATAGFRGQAKTSSLVGAVKRLMYHGSGGIAGGGFFEFDLAVARQVVFLAIVYVAKIVLSNLSFAYAQLPIYLEARIAIVPLSLLFSAYFGKTTHSIPILSSALIATLFLGIGTSRSDIRVTWESIVAGVFSSLFVALYPVQIQRTYKSLLSTLVPQGDLLSGFPSGPHDASGSKEEARAVWRLLHYTSLLSIIILTPIVLLSGEVGNIYRNCYFLDVFFHWLMMTCSGIGSWSVFFSTVLLTKTASPLTTTFLFIPRAAFILPVLSKFKMPLYSWVAIGMCWLSCGWFLIERRKEGVVLGRLRSGN